MPKSPTATLVIKTLREEAWIGDAVLELYARAKVLREQGALNAPAKTRFVRNQFLNCFGQPTKVEAEIGRCYRARGLDEAFAWIEKNLEPLFLKQEKKRKHLCRVVH